MFKIFHPFSCPDERSYVHDVLLKNFLGLEFESIPVDCSYYTIQHQSDGFRGKVHLPDLFLSKKQFPLPSLPLEQWILPDRLTRDSRLNGVGSLPVIYGSAENNELFNDYSNSLSLPIDVFGSVFFMLSRYEEVVNNTLDNHHRFPGLASIAFKSGFLEQPIVDQYVELLWLAMKSLWSQIQRKETCGKTWVTCDVDVPFDTRFNSLGNIIRTLAGDILRRRNFYQFSNSVKSLFENIRGTYKDPFNTFDWYMATCEKYGHRATFYFIADHSAGAIDGNYSINEPKVKELIKNISDRGHEICLHGSYNTFNNPEQIKKERNRLLAVCENLGLGSEVKGNRQHYLRWDTVQTPDHLEAAGFEYDATGSFADMPGFRYGTARPFKMWSWKKNSPLNLIQRPLIVMECSVLAERYLGLGYSLDSIDKILQLKESALKFGGDFTLLWHNSHFLNTEDQYFFIEAIS